MLGIERVNQCKPIIDSLLKFEFGTLRTLANLQLYAAALVRLGSVKKLVTVKSN